MENWILPSESERNERHAARARALGGGQGEDTSSVRFVYLYGVFFGEATASEPSGWRRSGLTNTGGCVELRDRFADRLRAAEVQ
jgi:hypothetical protein